MTRASRSPWRLKTTHVSKALLDALPGFKNPRTARSVVNSRVFSLPLDEGKPPAIATVDWRSKGVIPAAKDQGSCFSCTSFAIATTIESLHFMKTKKRIELSPGFIHSCLMGSACDQGTDLMKAIEAVCAHGVAFAFPEDYPFPLDQCSTQSLYTVKQRVCLWNANAAMNALVNDGPFAATMMIDPTFVTLTKGEVYRYKETSEPKLHSVCVIGFDQPNQCWIIANSFGERWGDDGCARIAFGDNAPMGERCGWQLVV